MLNIFRKVFFFFFPGRFLSQHIPAFKHCPYTHTHRYRHTHTQRYTHTHTDFPKTLHPPSSVAMSQHTVNTSRKVF